MAIPVFKPSIKRKDMDAVLTCMVQDSIGPGTESQRFSSEVAAYLELAGGIAFREYFRAISVVFDALGLVQGDKVVLSPLSPQIYIDVCASKGIVPIYADVEQDSPCISVESIENAIRLQPKAIIVYYSLGFIPLMDRIVELGIPVIEDISQALGGNTGAKRAGTFGIYSILSLESDEIITTGGGALVLAKEKRALTAVKGNSAAFFRDAFLPDMNAALGIIQIKNIERFIAYRSEIAEAFTKAVAGTRHKTFLQPGEGQNIYYSFPVLLNSGMKDVMQYARKKGVETQPAFSESCLARADAENSHCSNAKGFLLRSLLFPLYPGLGKKNAALIVKVLSTLP